MAAAFGPRFLCRRGTQKAQAQPQLGEDRWRPDLPHRRYRRRTLGLPPISARHLSAMSRVVIEPAVPDGQVLDNEIAHLRGLEVKALRARWQTVFRRRAPPYLPRHLLFRVLAYRLQADCLGDLE